MNLVLGSLHFPCDCLFNFIQTCPNNSIFNKTANYYMHFFQNSSVLASDEKNTEQIITCGISTRLYVGFQLSQLSFENMVSLPTLWHNVLTRDQEPNWPVNLLLFLPPCIYVLILCFCAKWHRFGHNTCTKPAPSIIIQYYKNFHSSTMFTRQGVLQ